MTAKKDDLRMQLIRTYYQTSRENLANRLRIRDQAIIIFLSTACILFGMTHFRRNQNSTLPLLVLPFLSFGTMILVNYHNEYIARIVHYIGNDLQKQIKKLDIAIAEWSSARGHLELHKNKWIGADRAAAERLLITAPGVFALLLNIRFFFEKITLFFIHGLKTQINQFLLWGWILGLVCLVLTISTNIKTNRFKAEVYASLPARK